jgi:hypothetical protein
MQLGGPKRHWKGKTLKAKALPRIARISANLEEAAEEKGADEYLRLQN